MLRSRLPVPSLLSLFAALLMLPPELLLGMAASPSDVPATDPKVQKSLAFAVEQYNKGKGDSINYFQVLRLVKALRQVEIGAWVDYHLMVELVETTCKKKPGWKMTYESIETCKQLPGNHKKPTCYFDVREPRFLIKTHLAITLCT